MNYHKGDNLSSYAPAGATVLMVADYIKNFALDMISTGGRGSASGAYVTTSATSGGAGYGGGGGSGDGGGDCGGGPGAGTGYACILTAIADTVPVPTYAYAYAVELITLYAAIIDIAFDHCQAIEEIDAPNIMAVSPAPMFSTR